MTSKLFSILIPTWNNLKFLQLCVESIRKNSTYEHEILIHINDGSDGTLEWVKEQGLSYTHSPSNVGVCLALNQLRPLVTTDYMLGLSSIRNREERWLSVEKRFITDIYERAKPEDKYVIWALLQRYLKNDIEVEAFRKLLETLEK